ncbi:type IV secretion system protein VirB4 [Duganella sp. SG902]|uniref:VirB4 family type IV secretion/conjugal transfer ATPase n=1 Tax=Duganella sp. SG902 TaxID=2587016 RepID=UPI00159D6921|nr:VirB4 family type IV secretion/conjugal transfer ATPase [Duganella sp. SG902]NVM77466.1 type IV secretion system protein VirB4 [Duganella sp. SG902]
MRALHTLRHRARAEVGMSRHVPFGGYLTTDVIRLRHNGDLLATWRLDGIPFETAAPDVILQRKQALHNFWNALGGGHCAIWAHKLRRTLPVNMRGLPSQPYARDFVARYQRGLGADAAGRQQHLATELYLTLVYRAPGAARRGWLRRLQAPALDTLLVRQREALQALEELGQRLTHSLQAYRPQRLGVFRREGRPYSQQAAFYGYLLNGVWEDIPYRDTRLNETLALSRLHFGDNNGMVEIWHPQRTGFAGLLDFQDYPRSSEPGMNNALLYSDYEYIEAQSFSMLGKRDALEALERQQGHLHAAEDRSPDEIRQMDSAIAAVNSGDIQMGEYHYSLAVFGDAPEQVARHLNHARGALQDGPGFKMALVDTVPECAWFAQLPGNWHLRPRQAIISSQNFTALAPLHNFGHGKAAGNPWGPALALMQTLSGELFFFNHHVSPEHHDALDEMRPANTVVVGQTGVGKTALTAGLMLHALKYPGWRGMVFDKDRSWELVIRRAGGCYNALRRGEPTGLAPFQLPLTETHVAFCERWLRILAGPSLPADQAEEDAEIAHAVRTVMHESFPYALRRLSAVWQNLKARGGGNSLRDRLRKWTAGHALGWAFDNPRHTHDFDDPRMVLYGYDCTEFIDDDELRAPTVTLLLHMTRQLIDGRPFTYYMEEFWSWLNSEHLEDFALNEQKTIRKLNGLGVFITTSPSDVQGHKISKTIVEQSVTKIFLPNPAADHDDYVHGFKLTEQEFDLVRNMGENSRLFLLKQNHVSVVLRYDLGHMPEVLNILSGTLENVQLLDAARAEVGDDPEDWEPILQRRILERRDLHRQTNEEPS